MYNYLEAFVFLIDNAPASSFESGAVDDADCKYLGLVKSEAGYKISKDERVRASTGLDTTLSYKIELTAEILNRLSDAEKESIDGVNASLLFLPVDGVTLPEDAVPLTTTLNSAGVVLPASPSGRMVAPMTISIEEDEKYGSGKVSPIKLSGEKSASTKAALRKTVTITDTV